VREILLGVIEAWGLGALEAALQLALRGSKQLKAQTDAQTRFISSSHEIYERLLSFSYRSIPIGYWLLAIGKC
jgi:hypothetical protein